MFNLNVLEGSSIAQHFLATTKRSTIASGSLHCCGNLYISHGEREKLERPWCRFLWHRAGMFYGAVCLPHLCVQLSSTHLHTLWPRPTKATSMTREEEFCLGHLVHDGAHTSLKQNIVNCRMQASKCWSPKQQQTTPAAVASRDNVTLSHRATFSLSNADALAICSIMQLRWHATSTTLIAVHLVLLGPLHYGSREENTAPHCDNSPCSLLKHSIIKCPHQCCFSMLHTADIFAIDPDSSPTLGAACVAPKVLQS